MNRNRFQVKNLGGAIAVPAVFLLCVIGIILATHNYIGAITRDRAHEEVTYAAELQAELIWHSLQREFNELDELAVCVQHGLRFDDDDPAVHAETREILLSIVESNRLSMLAFAGPDGNAVNYRGEPMGNISGLEFYSTIVRDGQEQCVGFLTQPDGTDAPCIVFSVPVYSGPELLGVLYKYKEIGVLEQSLFEDNILGTTVGVAVVDAGYRPIVVNETLEELLPEGTERFLSGDDSPLSGGGALSETGTVSFRFRDAENRECFAVCSPVEQSDWSLLCVFREDMIGSLSGEGPDVHLQSASILILILIIFFCFAYAVMTIGRTAALNREKRWREYQRRRDMKILYSLNLAMLDFDMERRQIDKNAVFNDAFHWDTPDEASSAFAWLRAEHPEIDCSEVERLSAAAEEQKQPIPFDTMCIMDGKTMWLHVVFIPIVTPDETVSNIVVTIQNVTEQHMEMQKALEMVSTVPGGIHRCYLSDPIHLEYASEGLIRMLGYTEEEFARLIGPEQDFSQCMAEEDRDRFGQFVVELSQREMTATCMYRMRKKDGALISVSDTMESRRNSEGIMYGYSVVTDISIYMERAQELQQELEEVRENLHWARVKISASQMQPHFLYNALSSIREIVYEDPDYASELLMDFTTHLRSCIKSMSSDVLIPFTEELKNIRAYVAIEKMRFGDRMNVIYDLQETDFSIIPLGVQPIVENAIRHGIYEKGSAGGTVTVHTRREDGTVIIEIEDNGVGFDVDEMFRQIRTGERDSTGLSNMIYRFGKIMGADVNICSEPGRGTTVRITIQGRENYEDDRC